jgi:hypothetical protein
LALLIAHSTGGREGAFYCLPPAQLVAQINAAAQSALESPDENFSLLAVLSQPVPVRMRGIVARPAIKVETNESDLVRVVEYHKSPPTTPEDPATKDYLAARTRLVHRIQRNLDGLQIVLARDSSVWNQSLAIVIATAIAFLWYSDRSAGFFTLRPTAGLILAGFSAGYLAPIFGDLVVAIRSSDSNDFGPRYDRRAGA